MWKQISPGLWMAEDTCTLYAIEADVGWVVINAGSGDAAEALTRVKPLPVKAVVLTHHFRDHTEGCAQWKALGAEIWGPYWEQEYLLDPQQHWIERQIWNSYDNRWDRMAPIAPVPVDRWLLDYDQPVIAGVRFEVLPAPGVSMSAVSLVFSYRGQCIAAVGELISAPGKIHRIAPLQYDYNDLNGAFNVVGSLELLATRPLDLALPSKGQPFGEVASAFRELQGNLNAFGEVVPALAGLQKMAAPPTLDEFSPGCFFIKGSGASTNLIRTATGKTITLDYGYGVWPARPMKQHRSTRRPSLLCPDELKKRFGTDRIDYAIVSHYHDDHINGLAMLQRLYGTEVWAGDHYADVLERPERYDLPCLWHEPLSVARHCAPGELYELEGIKLRLHPVVGHTRFASLIEADVDGVKLLHTGDQVFFANDGPWDLRGKQDSKLYANHVYKNEIGMEVDCYRKTYRLLEELQPKWLLTGHTPPYETNADVFRVLQDGAEKWERCHRSVLAMQKDDVYFGLDSQPAKLYPYRYELPAAQTLSFEAWVRNPYGRPVEGEARLIAPEGWKSEPVRFSAAARERVELTFTLEPPKDARCRRQPIALNLTIDGRNFGQVTEALVSFGENVPWQQWAKR